MAAWFSRNTVPFESIRTAVEGLAVTRLRQLDLSLRSNIEVYNIYGGYSQNSAADLSVTFGTNLDARVEAINNAYYSVLNQFDTHNPPNFIASQIRNHAHEMLDSQVTHFRTNIAAFQAQTGVKWNDSINENAINAAKLALDSSLELLLKAPKKKSTDSGKRENVNSNQTGKEISLAREYRAALFVAALSLLGFFGREMIWRDRTADRDRRIAEQQTLAKELFPLVDSVVAFGAADSAETVSLERLVVHLNTQMSTRNRLAHAFGPQIVALYDSLSSAANDLMTYATPREMEARRRGTNRFVSDEKWRAAYRILAEKGDKFEGAIIAGIGH